MPAALPDHTRPRIYTDIPDSVILTPDGNQHHLKPTNEILHFQSARLPYYSDTTPLVIRCAFNGRRHFEVNSGRYAVSDESYLLLNCGQRCGSYIDSATVVESFNVFYHPLYARDTLRALVRPDDYLLDCPDSAEAPTLDFIEKRYPHDHLVSPVLMQLRACVATEWMTRGWLEERLRLLLERLLEAHRGVRREIESFPAIRFATREELYRRLHRAREYMNACLHQPLTLIEIGAVACLSPHHFLRLFKRMFGETPHQYLTRRRLETARHLLCKSDQSVTAICQEVGFESLSSFSWLFRQRVGLSPEKFRTRRASGLTG